MEYLSIKNDEKMKNIFSAGGIKEIHFSRM